MTAELVPDGCGANRCSCRFLERRVRAPTDYPGLRHMSRRRGPLPARRPGHGPSSAGTPAGVIEPICRRAEPGHQARQHGGTFPRCSRVDSPHHHHRQREGVRDHGEALPVRVLLRLSREQGRGQERPQPPIVRVGRHADRSAQSLGRRRRHAEARRHAADGRGTARGRQAAGGRCLARARARADRPGHAARSRPRHRAPPQSRGIQQHRPRAARRQPPSGRRFSARRCGVWVRQHCRRAVAVAGVDGEVSVGGGRGGPDRGVRSGVAEADADAAAVRRAPHRRRSGVPAGLRRHRAQPAERLPCGAPGSGGRRIRPQGLPRRAAAGQFVADRSHPLDRRPSGAERHPRSGEVRPVRARSAGLRRSDRGVQGPADRRRSPHRGGDSADLRRLAGAVRRSESVDPPRSAATVHAAAEYAAGADRPVEAAIRGGAGGRREDSAERRADCQRRGRRPVLAGVDPDAPRAWPASTPAGTPTGSTSRRARGES